MKKIKYKYFVHFENKNQFFLKVKKIEFLNCVFLNKKLVNSISK